MSVTNIPPTLPSTTSRAFPEEEEALPLLPAYSSWFTFVSVHNVERRAFPDLLPSQESFYRECRDFMVQSYRARPTEPLTVTTCRRHLAGDVATLARVHAFLEHWGLINYRQSISLHPLDASDKKAVVDIKDYRAAHDISSLTELTALHDRTCRGCNARIGDGQSFYALVEKGVPDTTQLRCAGCFANGQLPPGRQSSDFILVPKEADYDVRGSWTDEETLKLLEAVEAHTGGPTGHCDWDAVARAAGRRKEDCVWRFLKLPFPQDIVHPDHPSNASEHFNIGMERAAVQTLDQIPASALPFAFVRSPTMALLSFLASQVHPQVAAVAAQSALESLSTLNSDHSPNGLTVANTYDGLTTGSTGDAAAMAESPADDGPKHILMDDAWIAATALALSAVKTRQLADEEARRVAQLHDHLVALQLRKVQQKLAQLEALSKGIEDERRSVEAQRVAVFYERCKLMAKLKEGSSNAASMLQGEGE